MSFVPFQPEDKISREKINARFQAGVPDTFTRAILRLDAAAEMNDALHILALGAGKYGYVIRLLDHQGIPLSGISVNSLTTTTGATAVADANGEAIGVSAAASISVRITAPYIDYQDLAQTISSTDLVTSATLRFQLKEGVILLTSSKTVFFSPYVASFSVACVGGGGGGGGPSNSGYPVGGAGGGGGYVSEIGTIQHTNATTYQATVGAGGGGSGNAGGSGASGGATSIKNDTTKGILCSAPGGTGGGGAIANGQTDSTGGAGNGRGGNGARGYGGSGSAATQSSRMVLAGGGGGAGTAIYGTTSSAGVGGSPCGGAGGWVYWAGESGSGFSTHAGGGGGAYGGGGGGSHHSSGFGDDMRGGTGGHGVIAIQVRYLE